jgi:hypothetical protein
MPPPTDARRHKQLEALHGLAGLKRDRALAGLAQVMRTRAALQAALADIARTDTTPDLAAPGATPAMVRAELAHHRWAEGQRRMLNLRLARIEADFARERPAAARAHGQVAALERLMGESLRALRRLHHRDPGRG